MEGIGAPHVINRSGEYMKPKGDGWVETDKMPECGIFIKREGRDVIGILKKENKSNSAAEVFVDLERAKLEENLF
jgi:hypothetical protein